MATKSMMLLEPGYVVRFETSRPSLAKIGKYCVGQVQSVSDRGVRLTLPDFLTGTFSNWDVLVPWEELYGCTVQTHEHVDSLLKVTTDEYDREHGVDEKIAKAKKNSTKLQARSVGDFREVKDGEE